ncbi:SNF2-related protein [Planktomarina sp.]|uniref:SNF2-related protein n=1 Tax=Planktomarina sp. TaxID=2024851 RepID=UPI003260ECC8
MKFRKYQSEIIDKAFDVLVKYGFVYLSMQVRTGKTLTAMGTAQKLGVNNMLFVTKKKAISSIESDYKLLNPKFHINVVNYESLHKVVGEYECIVLDEAHGMGAYPKPSKRTKMIKQIIKKQNPFVILMSGTPTPESFSQMYHQVYACPHNPFRNYTNFYKFAKDYVDVVQIRIGAMPHNNYSRGRQSILDQMKPYMISYTQKEAGFKVETIEKVLKVKMSDLTYSMVKQLKKNLVIEGKDEVVLADTGVKLMSKLHQLYSGTVKFESGKATVIDFSKAEFIRSQFKGMKIGIFYKFKAEYDALKEVYGDELTGDLKEFKTTNKNIALQVVSGREGISLKEADCLVNYNIDFSALSYWQSRDRMTTKDSIQNDVYWIFSEGGIEEKIYMAVTKKKDYTLKHFQKDLLSL